METPLIYVVVIHLISLSQAERSDYFRYENLYRIIECLMETDPYPLPPTLSDRYFKTQR